MIIIKQLKTLYDFESLKKGDMKNILEAMDLKNNN